MLVANLIKYEPTVDNSFDKFGIADMEVRKGGKWVKFEEAEEAFSTEVTQLKSKISALVGQLVSNLQGEISDQCFEVINQLRKLSAFSNPGKNHEC